MSASIHSLTEKEKQVLRLLVAGHDAKSVARHLDLSVHTVNERLREARRKMAASSSREAARQLRDIESQTPENIGHKSFGDALRDNPVTSIEPPDGRAPIARPAGWIMGALLMSIPVALAAMALFAGMTEAPAPPVVAATAAAPANETDAVRAARNWLFLVDAGDWQASWQATSRTFRSLNTQERWAEVAASVQAPLGPLIGHELISEEFVPAPPMGYQMVKFRSRYTNRPDAVISISLEREDDRWKVVGIVID